MHRDGIFSSASPFDHKKQFGTAYAASECVKVFDGRFFGGRKLSCHFWDGVTNYTVKEEDEKEEVSSLRDTLHPVLFLFSLSFLFLHLRVAKPQVSGEASGLKKGLMMREFCEPLW